MIHCHVRDELKERIFQKRIQILTNAMDSSCPIDSPDSLRKAEIDSYSQ